MSPFAQQSATNGADIDLAGLIALRQEARHLDIAPRGKVLATRSGGHLSLCSKRLACTTARTASPWAPTSRWASP